MAQANGKCKSCNDVVPETNLNKFYCGEECRRKAWRTNNPDDIEPDWDSFPKVIYY